MFYFFKKAVSSFFGAASYLLVTLLQAAIGAPLLVGIGLFVLIQLNLLVIDKLFSSDETFLKRMHNAFSMLIEVVLAVFLCYLIYGVKSCLMALESIKMGALAGWNDGFSAGIDKLMSRVRVGFGIGYIDHLNRVHLLSFAAFSEMHPSDYFSVLDAFLRNQATAADANKLTYKQFEAMALSTEEVSEIKRQHQRLTVEEIIRLELLKNKDVQTLLKEYQTRITELEVTQTCPILCDREKPILVFKELYQGGLWVIDPKYAARIYNKDGLTRQCCEFKAENPETRESMLPLMGAPVNGAFRFRFHDLISDDFVPNAILSAELNQLTDRLKRYLDLGSEPHVVQAQQSAKTYKETEAFAYRNSIVKTQFSNNLDPQAEYPLENSITFKGSL